MILLNNLLSPLGITCTIGCLGIALGSIRIKGVSLDMSGVLIVALIAGCGLSVISNDLPTFPALLTDMQTISSLGTALFMAVTSLSSGYELAAVSPRKACTFLSIGAGIVGINMLFLLLFERLFSLSDVAFSRGVFCGAMTSTPGLAALCEAIGQNSSAAMTGYGVAYVFGVVGTVLSVQFIHMRQPSLLPPVHKPHRSVKNHTLVEMLQLCLVIASGYCIGQFRLLPGGNTLGKTGGILLAGMAAGAIIKALSLPLLHSVTLNSFRMLGLLFFFTGSGLSAGYQLTESTDVRGILMAILLTAIPITLTYTITRYILKTPIQTALCIVCGVMTSTPAMGVLTKNRLQETDTATYSLTYCGALLAMVWGMTLLTSS